MEKWFASQEFQELKRNFASELSENVENWDSFWDILFTTYERGRMDGQA